MKTRGYILWAVLFALSGLFFTGCEKEEFVEKEVIDEEGVDEDADEDDEPQLNEAGLPLDIPNNVIVYKTTDNKPTMFSYDAFAPSRCKSASRIYRYHNKIMK